jgi:hypothetical protein
MSTCPKCEDGSKHPLFVYLLTDSTCINNPDNHTLVPYVGLSSNPLLYLHAHNRDDRRFKSGSQLTKPGAGKYQIELVCGPLYEGGKKFKLACRKGSRKVMSRMLFFADYARQIQLDTPENPPMLYVRDTHLMISLYVRREQGLLKGVKKQVNKNESDSDEEVVGKVQTRKKTKRNGKLI